MELFLDKVLEFEKEAGFSARLSEAPENWPQELSSELFKQLPYLSDYNVNVNLDRVEPNRGFAFGYADISNKTERPEQEHDEAGLPHIRIPLVIMERSVKPFTVFLDGERVLPLTEERVRETLFNPSTFDLSTSQPRDPSLVDNMTPPYRAGIGMGGETKTASAPLLKRIAPSLRESDVSSFTEKVASDPSLIVGFKRSGVAELLVDVCEKTKRASASDRLEAVANAIEPSVVTIHKLPGNQFLVKSANVNAFAGGPDAQGQVVDQGEAGMAMGDEQAQAMQPGQTVTAVSDPVGDLGMPQTNAKVIEEFGEYRVQDAMGNQLLGWVFPVSFAWDGNFTPQPVAVFSNGSAYAVQEEIAGEMVGKGTNLPKDTPRGDGVFYYVDGGNAVCTSPVTIGSSAAGPDGLPKFIGTDVFGNQMTITFVEGLKAPQRISDIEYALPDNWKFMRLNNQTQLVPDPVQFNKSAAARLEIDHATLFYNGSYNIEGGCGLHKIASDFRYELDSVGAEFILGLLGVDGATAKMKVAEARKKGSVKLAGLHSIRTLGERYSEAQKTASALAHQLPNLRRDLVKEAAVLEDESSVDKVLALNFINPDNIAEFVAAIPELEQTSEKLAEMLLYSYIGAKEIPEGAVERCMKNMEEVVLGLKALQHAEA